MWAAPLPAGSPSAAPPRTPQDAPGPPGRPASTPATANGVSGPARAAPAAGPNPYDDPPPLALTPLERPAAADPKRVTAAELARRAFEATLGVGDRPTKAMLDPPPWEPAKSIPQSELDALSARAEEIVLTTPELGDVFLVRKHTGKDRLELTFEEASTLRLLCDSFPGARVVGFKRDTKREG